MTPRARRTAAGLALLALAALAAWLWLRPGEEGSDPHGSRVTEAPPAAPGLQTATADGKPAAPTPGGAPDASRPIRGRVLREDRTPLAGARVRAFPDDLPEAIAFDEERAEAGVSRTTTDAEGRFDVAPTRDSLLLTVLADAAGHSPGSAVARPGESVEIVLRGPAHLVGTVRDVDGAPVAGARVRWLGLVAGVRVEREGMSAADGAYRVDGLPRRADAETMTSVVDVSHPGFAPQRLPASQAAVDDVERRLDLWLLRGATIVGRVTDAATGRPVAGARIFPWAETQVPGMQRPANGIADNPYFASVLGTATTDADGRFRVERVPAWGVHPIGIHTADRGRRRLGRLGVLADAYATEAPELWVPAEGETVEMDVALDPGGTVRGRVIDGSGFPVGRARVHAYAEGGMWRSIPPIHPDVPGGVVTDAEGFYALSGVRDGPVTVGARRDDDSLGTKEPVAVVAKAGEVVQAPDLVLGDDRPFVRIAVVDTEGRPIAGAFVANALPGERTAGDGRANVHFEGLEGTLLVRASGFEPAVVDAPAPSQVDPPEVRVVLRRATVERAPATSPADGARPGERRADAGVVLEVEVLDATSGRVVLKHDVLLRVRKDGWDERWGGTGVGPGVVRFEGVPPGVWELQARAEGYEDRIEEVAVREDTTRTVRLTPGLVVAGRCRDATGAPVGGGRLFFGSAAADVPPTGTFRLLGAKRGAPDRLTFARTGEGGEAEWFVAVPFADVTFDRSVSDLEVVLAPAGATTIDVRSDRIARHAGATESQRDAGKRTRLSLVADDGRVAWRATGLYDGKRSLIAPVGTWTLRVEVPEVPVVERPVALRFRDTSPTVVEVP